MASPLASKIRIRTYEPRDHAAAVDLFLSGMLSYMDPPMPAAMKPFFDNSINGDLASIEATYMGSGGHFWVATTDDDAGHELVVGMVGLEIQHDKSYELRRIFVRGDYQRYGVGKQLVATLEQWAKEHGAARVWLSTGGPLVNAQKFYERLGYQVFKTGTLAHASSVETLYYEKIFVD